MIFKSIPIYNESAIAATEFKILCDPIKFNFMFLISFVFCEGNEIFKSNFEYSFL